MKRAGGPDRLRWRVAKWRLLWEARARYVVCRVRGHRWRISFDIRICRRCHLWDANPEWETFG